MHKPKHKEMKKEHEHKMKKEHEHKMKKGGKVKEHHVEGKKAHHRMDKYARGGSVGEAFGNKDVLSEAKKGTDASSHATSAKVGKRPGLHESSVDSSDD